MWLLVGLGNPGIRYVRTRHNVGFMVLDRLAAELGLTFKEKQDYRFCSGSMGDQKVILMEPLTFMNLSGRAVRSLYSKYAVLPEHTVVVHDDLDIGAGKLKIRKGGSSGGHKGVESIIQHMGTRDFLRLRVGIGRDQQIPVEDYVLGRFRKDEQPLISEAVVMASDALSVLVLQGRERAMNRYN